MAGMAVLSSDLRYADPVLPSAILGGSQPTPDPAKLRIPTLHSLDDCVRLWQTGDRSKNVNFPVSLYLDKFKSAQFVVRERRKINTMRTIMDELLTVYGGDVEAFKAAYPNHNRWSQFHVEVAKCRAGRNCGRLPRQ
jgi:hypothetical protein